MEKVIFVTIRKVYGVETMYPACDGAHLACELAGTKTVTLAMLSTLNKRCVKVKQAPAQVSELSKLLAA